MRNCLIGESIKPVVESLLPLLPPALGPLQVREPVEQWWTDANAKQGEVRAPSSRPHRAATSFAPPPRTHSPPHTRCRWQVARRSLAAARTCLQFMCLYAMPQLVLALVVLAAAAAPSGSQFVFDVLDNQVRPRHAPLPKPPRQRQPKIP